MIALAIAIIGVLGMLIIDYGPWNRPRCKRLRTFTARQRMPPCERLE
jgi:hypothetical protein